MNSNYIIPGCLLVGLGVGMILEYRGPGVLIGLGVGLILTTIVNRRKTPEQS